MPKSAKKQSATRSSRSKSIAKAIPAKPAAARKSALAPVVSAKSSSAKSPSRQAPTKERSGSKQATVLGMLREPSGTTIAHIVQATGWQQHSVRGFFAGVVRKKLKLNLISEASERGRVYRIAEGNAGSKAAVLTTRTAA